MKVAILGYGSQGVSAAEYWQRQGHDITICDNNESVDVPEHYGSKLGHDYLNGLHDFDLIVRSPSIHPTDIITANDQAILDKVTSNTNEFMKVCPTRNLIGVTGTKGKGTTSMLIAGMLKSAGKTVHIGGNIGTPPLEMLKEAIQPDDWVVLELANFQLIDLKSSPRIAVCVMVEPEHMDWHPNVAEYFEAKRQLFRWQQTDDTAIYFAESENAKNIAAAGNGTKIPYYQKPGAYVENNQIKIDDRVICEVDSIKLLGRHNWQNVCAAVTAVWQITQDVEAIANAIKNTAGLPYRLEFIREFDGVSYYNDSFGTTPETAIVAIQAFDQPKIVILGGSSKGSSYDELADTVVGSNVKYVVAIGETGPDIIKAIETRKDARSVEWTYLEGKPTMEEIVTAARTAADQGDVILLSTACASFDLFQNYKDRGDQFNQVVRSLA